MKTKKKVQLTPEGEAYILSNYSSMSDLVIAEHLKVGISIIKSFRYKHKLNKRDGVSYSTAFSQKYVRPTSEEDEVSSDTIDSAMCSPNMKMPESTSSPAVPPPVPPPVPLSPSEVTDKIPQKQRVLEDTKDKQDPDLSYSQEKEKLQRYLAENVSKLLPRQCMKGVAEREDFIDKFIILRRTFNDTEWRDFLSHWMRYMEEHAYDFNIAEDFDDLTGLVRELIIQANIFDKNKETRESDAFYQVYMKQFNESVARQKKFQDSLKLSRRSRKSEKDYDKESFAEVVAMFDSEETRKIMAEADKNDNLELLSYMDKIRKKMKEELGATVDEIDGQESALIMGMDEGKVDSIANEGIKTLQEEAV